MALTNVNFRMDSDLKRDMEETCKELGLNMTTALTIFAKKMVRERRIPFEVSVDPFYSEENQKRLREAFDALDNGEGSEHELIEVDDD
ncbi:MAG: type II toxin-antitoxin system RelB/DinJ family antitoxin [Ruminococcaceae bacterium]|nr:type II toxin-antitoxin system RelB/DinJ family antitoxin [Oscillospiraceae bacterium]